MAAHLRLSRKTVEAYLTSIYERTGFAGRMELSVWAEREGWLDASGAGPGRSSG